MEMELSHCKHLYYTHNSIDRDEFVTKYLDTRTKLNERLNEVYKKISDHKRQRDEMFTKL
jgi:hypothetical protein